MAIFHSDVKLPEGNYLWDGMGSRMKWDVVVMWHFVRWREKSPNQSYERNTGTCSFNTFPKGLASCHAMGTPFLFVADVHSQMSKLYHFAFFWPLAGEYHPFCRRWNARNRHPRFSNRSTWLTKSQRQKYFAKIELDLLGVQDTPVL